MRSLGKATAALTAATIILAGCGGGGGGASTPHAAAPAATPAAVSHTVVGTGKLTLSLPKVITATKNGKTVAVRAIPRGKQRAQSRGTTRTVGTTGTARSPRFVDPSPNPGNGPCPGGANYLDIYANGTLLIDLDGLGEESDSLCVQPTADSTQTVNLPLYSTSANQIVAVEWDATGEFVLAIGESDSGSFDPGSTITLPALTMLMNVYDIGITDLGFSDPEEMDFQSYGESDFTCTGLGSSSQFAVYPTDGLGDFVPVAGSGGTSTATATGVSDFGGTTVIAQNSIAGVYNIAWDNNCDSITANATASNPAYVIWNDVADEQNENAYPGITNLFFGNVNNFQSWFTPQLDFPTGTGEVDVQNDTDG
jgi:hypothetical protein